eukprot:408834_1
MVVTFVLITIAIFNQIEAQSSIQVTCPTQPISDNYVVIRENVAYDDAFRYCMNNFNTTLATISNDFQAEELLNTTETGAQYWIGMFYDGDDWYWLDTLWRGNYTFDCNEYANCSDLVYWNDTQPSFIGTCGALNSVDSINSMMFVQNCSHPKQFICNRPRVCPDGSYQFETNNKDMDISAGTNFFDISTITECLNKCLQMWWFCDKFSWAPIGVDPRNINKRICRIYGNNATTTPLPIVITYLPWKEQRIFCYPEWGFGPARRRSLMQISNNYGLFLKIKLSLNVLNILPDPSYILSDPNTNSIAVSIGTLLKEQQIGFIDIRHVPNITRRRRRFLEDNNRINVAECPLSKTVDVIDNFFFGSYLYSFDCDTITIINDTIIQCIFTTPNSVVYYWNLQDINLDIQSCDLNLMTM